MGKAKWRRGKKVEKVDEWKKNKDGYETIIKKNENFEKYYKQLEGLVEPDQFDVFLETLKQPLPITFRITSYKSHSNEILKILKEKHLAYIDEMTRTNREKLVEGSANKGASLLVHKYGSANNNSATNNEASNTEQQSEDQPLISDEIYKCLSWYPGELGWQVNLSRQDVRKNVHLEKFKQFLINQTENGNLNRQEAVSMIPPLLLDVKSHHKILDMCASPGSKTAQLIEFLHNDTENTNNPIPEGFVIANDLDNKRCYMLMHQLKRLESPNFMIINQDASALPNFRNGNGSILYDRILADVPCSGDGTFRKNIDIWTKWSFAHACNLHSIQTRIARRAVELLQPGGLMVYSTCSLNPIEDEAVVYNLLLKFAGQLELVDSRHKLTGMKTVNGLLKWNVMGRDGQIYDTAEQIAKTDFACLIRPHMFPPEESVGKELNLDRCIRILPHHQNTGGFFIAVIRKLPLVKQCDVDGNYLSSTTATETKEPVNEAQNGANKPDESSQPPEADVKKTMKAPPAKRLKQSWLENPFQFYDSNEPLQKDWLAIKEFYGITDDFPVEQLLTRNKKEENIRSVYIVSKQIKDLTINNADRFKFINMGVSIFTRADIKDRDRSNIEYRISQEGVDIVVKYLTRRVVMITEKSDLIKILTEANPLVVQLSTSLQEQVKEKCGGGVCGSFVLRFALENNESPITFVSWLGKNSIRPLMNIQTRGFFLTVLGVDQSTISEACEKIKQEDKLNSEKSLLTNPQYQKKLNKDKQGDGLEEEAEKSGDDDESGEDEENNEQINND